MELFPEFHFQVIFLLGFRNTADWCLMILDSLCQVEEVFFYPQFMEGFVVVVVVTGC